MPYIHADDREGVYPENDTPCPLTAGELAYALTRMIQEFIKANNCAGRPFNFDMMAEIEGTVVLTMREFWRRVELPYERGKCEANGDVYDAEV
jgi:hypothetical protein